MPVGIAEVEAAAAVPGVQFPIVDVPRVAAICESRRLHAPQDPVELADPPIIVTGNQLRAHVQRLGGLGAHAIAEEVGGGIGDEGLEELLGDGTEVFGKLEFLQRTGTFKARVRIGRHTFVADKRGYTTRINAPFIGPGEQVYEGMVIGAAAPSDDDKRKAPHLGYNVVPPEERYDAAFAAQRAAAPPTTCSATAARR